MNKIAIIKSFIAKLSNQFKLKLLLIIVFGLFNSLFQSAGIVLIIPLLEAYNSSNYKGNSVAHFLIKLGWNGELEWLLVAYFFILIGFAVFKASFSYLSQLVIVEFSNKHSISSLKSVLQAKWEFYIKYSPSQLINLFNVEARSVRLLITLSFRFVQSVILIGIQLSLAIWISWKLTIITSLLLLILYIIQQGIFKKSFRIGGKRVGLNEQLQLFLSETFSAIKFLKLHKLVNKRHHEYEKNLDSMFVNDLKTARLEAFSELLFISSGALMIIGIIYFGLNYQLVTVSELLVLLVLLSRVITQTQGVVKMTGNIVNQLPSFQRFDEVVRIAGLYSEKSQHKKNESNSTDHLQLENISFGYTDQLILDRLSLSFEKGKTYLFFGKSGNGKTTTLDIIAGLITPQSGQIKVNHSIVNSGYNQNFSYVLQDTILFHGSIQDNICVGEHFSDDKLNFVIQQTGLTETIQKLPNGIQTIIQEGGKGLSGGEKQRIAIARALIRDSDVLLLDEITSALDTQNETKILETISSLKHDKIIIVVAHRERLKDWADEVIEF